MWTPESYRDLARKCLARAAKAEAPNSDFMREMAVEYEAKAEELENRGRIPRAISRSRR